MDTKRRAWSPSDTCRKHLTAVEAVNAIGQVIDPMLIAQGKVIQERWFTELNDNTLLAVTESGYMDDETALKWLVHFERLTRPSDPEEFRLLICDNYGSHTFDQFLEFARDSSIIVLGLPPHTSHFLQPLDVVLFQPYKHYHRQAVLQATRTGCLQYGYCEFMAHIEDIRKATFTAHNIRAAFKKSGLFPIDEEAIIRFLRVEYSATDQHQLRLEFQQREALEDAIDSHAVAIINAVEEEGTWKPATPPNQTAGLNHTPLTIRTLYHHSDYLQNRLDDVLSSPSQAILEQYFHGSAIQAEKGA
jgi:hypothetical protein